MVDRSMSHPQGDDCDASHVPQVRFFVVLGDVALSMTLGRAVSPQRFTSAIRSANADRARRRWFLAYRQRSKPKLLAALIYDRQSEL
jgi:hypothetical protein